MPRHASTVRDTTAHFKPKKRSVVSVFMFGWILSYLALNPKLLVLVLPRNGGNGAATSISSSDHAGPTCPKFGHVGPASENNDDMKILKLVVAAKTLTGY